MMLDPQMMAALGGPPGSDQQGAPPPSIQLPSAPAGPTARSTSSDAGDNSDNLRSAIDAIQSYIEGEEDDGDLALASEIQAKLQKLLASQQDLMDKATGAGPGAKLLRKQSAQGGGSTGGY